ncbi:MAG: PD40 domain-containing protein [Pleurocapsa minor GSE-CHR-MK-17-07R]|jgi:WD40 repeat protein|nr:PD40 domain-containing protein [Pleurocapsa minor GSE-CHR-MK 17-07R]
MDQPNYTTGYTTSVAWSRDSNYVAVSYVFYDLTSGLSRAFFTISNVPGNSVAEVDVPDTALINALVWSPDSLGLYIADSSGRLWYFTFSDTALTLVFSNSGEPIREIAISPDGLFLSFFYDEIALLHLESNQVIESRTISESSSRPVLAEWIRWSPDGTRIATGQRDGTVRIWDANNLNLLKVETICSHKGSLAGEWLANSVQMLVACYDENLILWNSADSILLPIHTPFSFISNLRARPGSNQFMVQGDGTHLAELDSHNQSASFSRLGDSHSATWSHDGSRLYIASASEVDLSPQHQIIDVPPAPVRPAPSETRE